MNRVRRERRRIFNHAFKRVQTSRRRGSGAAVNARTVINGLAGGQSGGEILVVTNLSGLRTRNLGDFVRGMFAAGGGQRRAARARGKKLSGSFSYFFIRLNFGLKLWLNLCDEKENHFAQAGWELLPVARDNPCIVW
jgi:hypothetical protein